MGTLPGPYTSVGSSSRALALSYTHWGWITAMAWGIAEEEAEGPGAIPARGGLSTTWWVTPCWDETAALPSESASSSHTTRPPKELAGVEGERRVREAGEKGKEAQRDASAKTCPLPFPPPRLGKCRAAQA